MSIIVKMAEKTLKCTGCGKTKSIMCFTLRGSRQLSGKCEDCQKAVPKTLPIRVSRQLYQKIEKQAYLHGRNIENYLAELIDQAKLKR